MEWWVILLIVYFGLAIIGLVQSYYRFRRKYLEIQKSKPPVTYGEKMRELTSRLVEASQAVDEVLTEMADAHRKQEEILKQQSKRVETLSAAEKELKQRVDSLKTLPLPVAEYFVELTRRAQEKQEKQRSWRDYRLIFISAALSAGLTIGIMALFG